MQKSNQNSQSKSRQSLDNAPNVQAPKGVKTPNGVQGSLLPRLGLFVTVTIVIGAVIGSGIFKKPALMASQLGSPEILLSIWVVAGIITLFGALTNVEIAGLLPRTGGQYVFFQEMYGKFPGFLYGWAIFAVIQSGSIASISYIFGHYSQFFFTLPRFSHELETTIVLNIPFIGSIFPLENIGVKLVTIGVITFLSGVNYLGVLLGGRVTSIFTILKVTAILLLVVFAFASHSGTFENFTLDAPGFNLSNGTLFAGIIAALSGAFWAYDGWNNITYIAGEVKSPQRTIPRALIAGTIVIIFIYILINLAYLYILPVEQMRTSELVAADVAQVAIGGMGAAFVAAAVMISTFGTASGTIMASARVYYAMASDSIFFKSIGKIHPRFSTPANSLILQCFWACVLVMSGTFDLLTDMLIFVSWVFYAFGAYGIFVLRKKMPDAERSYKVPLYPWIPIIFILFATAFVIFTLYTDIESYIDGTDNVINSVLGIFLVALGIPFYLYFIGYHKKVKKYIFNFLKIKLD